MAGYFWFDLSDGTTVIANNCPVEIAVDLMIKRWCEIKQKDGKMIAGMDEDEMHHEGEKFRAWVKSNHPDVLYNRINEDLIFSEKDNFYESILGVGIRNRLEDGRPVPIEELSDFMQSECPKDLYEISEIGGKDVASLEFREWLSESHPLMFDRLLEYQSTQDKNVFEYSG